MCKVKMTTCSFSNNILHTCCTPYGKICNVIIDGGSCENCVPKEVIDKLKLKAEPHQYPYSISWFKKENEVKVSHHFIIHFSIGKNYHDEI